MSAEGFLLMLAAIALSLAGFSGLVAGLRPPAEPWTKTDVWRLRRIAHECFNVLFLALLPLPLFGITGDEALTIRIASVVLAVALVADVAMLTPEWRRDWPGDPNFYLAWSLNSLVALGLVANAAVWANAGVYEAALVQALFWPSVLFRLALRDLRVERG
jgi:hypothetical protein